LADKLLRDLFPLDVIAVSRLPLFYARSTAHLKLAGWVSLQR